MNPIDTKNLTMIFQAIYEKHVQFSMRPLQQKGNVRTSL